MNNKFKSTSQGQSFSSSYYEYKTQKQQLLPNGQNEREEAPVGSDSGSQEYYEQEELHGKREGEPNFSLGSDQLSSELSVPNSSLEDILEAERESTENQPSERLLLNCSRQQITIRQTQSSYQDEDQPINQAQDVSLDKEEESDPNQQNEQLYSQSEEYYYLENQSEVLEPNESLRDGSYYSNQFHQNPSKQIFQNFNNMSSEGHLDFSDGRLDSSALKHHFKEIWNKVQDQNPQQQDQEQKKVDFKGKNNVRLFQGQDQWSIEPKSSQRKSLHLFNSFAGPPTDLKNQQQEERIQRETKRRIRATNPQTNYQNASDQSQNLQVAKHQSKESHDSSYLKAVGSLMKIEEKLNAEQKSDYQKKTSNCKESVALLNQELNRYLQKVLIRMDKIRKMKEMQSQIASGYKYV